MIILPPMQPPEKKKSYKELREEQLAAEAAAKKAAEPPEVRKVLVLVSTGVEQKLNPLYKPGIKAYLNPQITGKLICPSLGCIWSIYDFIFM